MTDRLNGDRPVLSSDFRNEADVLNQDPGFKAALDAAQRDARSAPPERPALEGLREIAHDLLVETPTPPPERALNGNAMAAKWDGIERDAEVPAASEAASSERSQPESRRARAQGDPQSQLSAFDAPEKSSPDPVRTTQDAGTAAIQPHRNLPPPPRPSPRAAAPVAVSTQAALADPASRLRWPTRLQHKRLIRTPAPAAAPEQQASAKIPGVATLAINTLADALRRKPPQGAPAVASNAAAGTAGTPGEPETTTPAAPSSRLDAARDTVEARALSSLLKNFRRQQPPAEAAAPEASPRPPATPRSPSAPSGRPDAAPPPSGGARDKLALFDAARMQSRRDLEQVKGAANAGAAVLQFVAALEQHAERTRS